MYAVMQKLEQGISVDLFFRYFRDRAIVGFHVSASIVATFVSLSLFLSTPRAMFCESDVDVCSCTARVYPQYSLACSNQTLYLSTLEASPDGAFSVLIDMSKEEIVYYIGGVSLFAVVIGFATLVAFWKNRGIDERLRNLTGKSLNSKQKIMNKLRRALTEEIQKEVRNSLKQVKGVLEAYVVPHGHLELKEKIGQGTYGEVWKGDYRGTPVAVKRAVPEELDHYLIELFREECVLMANLQRNKGISHPNLVQMLHCCWENEMLLILEYCEMGSLDEVMQDAASGTSGILKYLVVHNALRPHRALFGRRRRFRRLSLELGTPSMCRHAVHSFSESSCPAP